MTYNKSEIMRKAHVFYRNNMTRKAFNIVTFADALRFSWAKAKEAAAKSRAGYVNAMKLVKGDTIRFSPSDCASLARTATIETISDIKGFNGITVTCTDGSSRVFMKYDAVERVAA